MLTLHMTVQVRGKQIQSSNNNNSKNKNEINTVKLRLLKSTFNNKITHGPVVTALHDNIDASVYKGVENFY